MRIGFVSTWLERGATYVTKTYISLLEEKHDIFVYARGGEVFEKGNPKFDEEYVTWGLRLGSTNIDWKHFSNWIKRNKLDIILFNEQKEIINVLKTKLYFPSVKIGAYIDYYTEETVSDFKIYDFLLCNTKRHYSVFEWHEGAYYIPWGTNINVFNYDNKDLNSNEVVFFHSVGMSPRKGTDILVKSFIKSELYKNNSKLIIHSQINIDYIIDKEQAEKYNIEIIIKEVPAPGLYYTGDIYVYPTTLDGLGLTIYEALASGLPVITTDCAPMNEVINEENGRLVQVDLYRSRKDGYYWPLSHVNEESLIKAMKFYVDESSKLDYFKEKARIYAKEKLNIEDRKMQVLEIFENTPLMDFDFAEINLLITKCKRKKRDLGYRVLLEAMLPNVIKHFIRERLEVRRSRGK